jgi:ethanolamine ammonia-lyase large subunit
VCILLVVLLVGEAVNVMQSLTIMSLSLWYQSSQFWESNRKKRVPNFEPKKEKKKKMKERKIKSQSSVSEGEPSQTLVRTGFVNKYFDLF